MGSPRTRALRALAHEHRRAADRLVLLRLRMARGFADAGGAEPVDATIEGLRRAWTSTHYADIGALATRLRSTSAQLGDAAQQLERAEGSRMGGYRGAGYLGAGDAAAERARDLARALAARSSSARLSGDLGEGLHVEVGVAGTVLRPVRLPGRTASHAIGAALATPVEPLED